MDSQELMGYLVPTDEKVPVPVRDWNAMKLAAWRSKELADIVVREARKILDLCRHTIDCAATDAETEPCLPDCPDREQRMSALVVLTAAKQLAPADARKPADGPYYAPSREYFSEVLAALAANEIELDVLHGVLRTAGISVPSARNSIWGGGAR